MDENMDADRIIVGVDGSQSSVEALRYAARMAAAFDAPLEAVAACYDPPYVDFLVRMDFSPEENAELVLDRAILEAFGSDPPGLKRTVVSGAPTRSLIELSKTAAMLVLGSRGHGGFMGLLIGSVSAACAEHAHCPVLIVHSRATTAAPDTEDTP